MNVNVSALFGKEIYTLYRVVNVEAHKHKLAKPGAIDVNKKTENSLLDSYIAHSSTPLSSLCVCLALSFSVSLFFSQSGPIRELVHALA